tara:strand:- start:264 stop:518 length:255 start_codon:yes stop_codon:yes gene_type:complete
VGTGYILGLGLGTIVLVFYIVLNFPMWKIEYNIRISKKMQQPKKYHDWVYMADDSINKVLKSVVYCLFAYGAYVFCAELWSKYL